MLRRSVTAIIACAAVVTISGCGVKGPLRLPPGQSAPAPTGQPPGVVPTTTTSDRPDYTPPAPATPAPDDKDRTE
ncbi:MAG TPA: lipoprotein [Casimicrobiaceae bacterium]|nr:lipoprotein [Casimicrobiaceae bacterium]